MYPKVSFNPEKRYEIVNGKPVERIPGGLEHRSVCITLLKRVGGFVAVNGLGETYKAASFQIGSNERIPDLAFVSLKRFPAEGEPETKWPIPPDLAIEVMAPNDYYEKVLAKTAEYLDAGVKQVWLVLPENQTVIVYRSATNITAFPPESDLVCEDLFPGFRCPLSEIFKNPGKSA